MEHRENNKASFVEVLGSIKFDRKSSSAPAGQWPQPGFAVSKTTHHGEAAPDDYKQLVRSSN